MTQKKQGKRRFLVLLAIFLIPTTLANNLTENLSENSSLLNLSILMNETLVNISHNNSANNSFEVNLTVEAINLSIDNEGQGAIDQSNNNISLPIEQTAQNQIAEIGQGFFYHVKSSIFKWFERTAQSLKSTFVSNVQTYEGERSLNSEYYRLRNEKLKNSYTSNIEPPFNDSICPESLPIEADTRFTFCSCGDGVCASYEDKCTCPKDCGYCPEGLICKRGACEEIIENTCMNRVCDEGENETCPWDCRLYMQEETEEELSNVEKLQLERSINESRANFFRSHGMTEEEISKALNEDVPIEKETVAGESES